MSAPDVIVVGGGVAGITSALRLAQRGARVLLLETRKKLGGRATSFEDPRTGLVIDNCQHVALGCCTNYLDLCRRLGVLDKIEWQDTIYWVEPGGRVSEMSAGALPAPSHYLGSLLGAAFLSPREKIAVSRAMTAAMRTDRRREAGRTFGAWLTGHAQPRSAIDRFWAPIIISACNLGVDRVAASVALHVVQEGFLAHRESTRMGVAGAPLVELYDPALDAIAGAGGEVRLGVGVARLDAGFVETTRGERIEAPTVICALPGERIARRVDERTRDADARFAVSDRMEHSPILGVHIAFDRPVMAHPNAVLVGRETQWLFRKDDAGAMIHAVISAADDWMALDEDAILERVLADVHACFPESVEASVTSVRAVKEKLATFAPTPAFESERPATTGPSGIILAGDYVQTGWPATMEGAARAGAMAAAAALGDPIDSMLVSARRPAPLVRVFGARGLRDQDRVATPASA